MGSKLLPLLNVLFIDLFKTQLIIFNFQPYKSNIPKGDQVNVIVNHRAYRHFAHKRLPTDLVREVCTIGIGLNFYSDVIKV